MVVWITSPAAFGFRSCGLSLLPGVKEPGIATTVFVSVTKLQQKQGKRSCKRAGGAATMVACNVQPAGDSQIFEEYSSQDLFKVMGSGKPKSFDDSPLPKLQSGHKSEPMTIAVAEFKGPVVHGVVRFAQEVTGLQACVIEAVIDGLAPGAHGWSVHEYGDLTQGPASTGAAYHPSNLPIFETPAGDLGMLVADRNGHAESSATNSKLMVTDMIGRSVVLYAPGLSANVEKIAAAVIGRSDRAGVHKRLCNCDGFVIWECKS